MKVLRPEVDPGDFFRQIRTAPSRVLLLDYDGTLAPFREERDRAVPYPEARERVERIIEAGHTRVVVVSGRAVEDLRPLLGIEPPPEIWGTHGWERLHADGTLERVALPGPSREALGRARERVETPELEGRVEVKPASVAVHVRGLGAGEAESALERVRASWEPLADTADVEVHGFDGGVELRPSGRHKGTAVDEALAGEPPDAAVAYLGDDLTDEDAFRALGDRGLAVLVRAELRETAAHVWLRPPGELMAFLDRWAREADQGGGAPTPPATGPGA